MKKGNLLRKGIAAFLLLVMVGSSFAFAAETTETTATTAPAEAAAQQETGEGGEELKEGSQEFETVGTVKVEGEDEQSDEAVEELAEEDNVMIFSQTAPVKETVRLSYTKKIRYESYFTHDYRVTCDGKTIISYCIEPAKNHDTKQSYTATPYNAGLMKKALYYSYGNPGYNQKTAQYLSKVSRKSCYKGNNGVYALCHIMLSYIYDGERSKTDAFKGCSSSTKRVVKNLIAAVKSWPDPPGKSEIGLSATSVDAVWNEETQMQETPEIKVGGTSGNSINVPVPAGTTLHKGDTEATTGSVKVSVDESFSITAPSTVKGTYSSPAMEAAITDFQPYIITPKGKQSQLFNVSTINSIAYSIRWVDFGRVDLIKTSSDPGITDGNTYYSLKGAEYGLYSKTSNRKYGNLITDGQGKASIDNIPYGEYYLKELEPSRGYEIDVAAHDITVASPSQSETVLEKPVVPDITTNASVAETGQSSATEGGTVNISDTVKYSGVEPGMDYTIVGRLVNKTTGEDVPGTDSKVSFTPEKSSGSLKMDYSVDSKGLGGSTVVAFEKLYQGDNLIATHEDINNKAQSVNFIKPKEKSPDMGDSSNLWLAAFALAISLLAGIGLKALKN